MRSYRSGTRSGTRVVACAWRTDTASPRPSGGFHSAWLERGTRERAARPRATLSSTEAIVSVMQSSLGHSQVVGVGDAQLVDDRELVPVLAERADLLAAELGDGDAVQRHAHSGRLDDHACGHCERADRKSTRLNSSHLGISYAVCCLKKN